jgi:hypothetical protein
MSSTHAAPLRMRAWSATPTSIPSRIRPPHTGAPDEAQKPFRNIHFAHSDLSGIALFEEAFFHGNKTASEILGT